MEAVYPPPLSYSHLIAQVFLFYEYSGHIKKKKGKNDYAKEICGADFDAVFDREYRMCGG